jgi:hypothetical protein
MIPHLPTECRVRSSRLNMEPPASIGSLTNDSLFLVRNVDFDNLGFVDEVVSLIDH